MYIPNLVLVLRIRHPGPGDKIDYMNGGAGGRIRSCVGAVFRDIHSIFIIFMETSYKE